LATGFGAFTIVVIINRIIIIVTGRVIAIWIRIGQSSTKVLAAHSSLRPTVCPIAGLFVGSLDIK